MFKKIIAATDRVNVPDAPVMAAIRIAETYGADLRILHILEPGAKTGRFMVRHFEAGNGFPAAPVNHGAVESKMNQTYRRFISRLPKARVTVSAGRPWEEILRTSRRSRADLIVMGPHTELEQAASPDENSGRIGSTVQGVVARENCPVMIVNDSITGFQTEFKKILVGIDFSMASECALCFSARISRTMGATVYPLFMIPVAPYPKFTREQHEANQKSQTRKLSDFCDFYIEDSAHEYIVQSGMFPGREIVKWACRLGADLIMLGSHTRFAKGKWYAGSVVEEVGSTAPCPVVVVNDPDALQPWEDLQPFVSEKRSAADRSIHLFDPEDGRPVPTA